MNRPYLQLFVFIALAMASTSAWAHRLVPDDGTHTSSDAALLIEDPDLSQVVYHEVTTESNALWMRLERLEGDTVYWQLGMPAIDGLEDYRPTVVLLGPGLPEVDVPFDIPEGLGGIVTTTAGLDAEPFSEEFTGTEDLIVKETTFEVPASGTYYLVAYEPDGAPGKFWLAIGKREAFGLSDILSYSDVLSFVRAYHEVDDEPLPLLPRVLYFVSRVLQTILRPFQPIWAAV